MNHQTATSATILVFVALPEEHDRLLNFFPAKDTIPDSQYVFVEHNIDTDGFRLISVVAAGMGTEHAFDATSAGIARFKPNMVVCIGIAGSLTADLKLGDVAVSSEVIDISQNIKISEVPRVPKRTRSNRRKTNGPSPSQTIIELSPKTLQIPPELTASFRFLRSHPVLKEDLATWTIEAAKRRGTLIGKANEAEIDEELLQSPSAEIGAIISGPVVASNAFKKTLKNIDRKVLAVETESSGVYKASSSAKIPCITLRGISDHADINKNALERTTKKAARELAADNVIAYFSVQLKNPSFMRIASVHLEEVNQPELFQSDPTEPDKILANISAELDCFLEKCRRNTSIVPTMPIFHCRA